MKGSLSQNKYAKRWYVLLVVMSGVFLSTMDSGMVNVALPSIMRSFGLRLENAEFVVTVYLLTITVTLVFWGQLADRWGRGKVYLTGMIGFSFGGILCFFAPNFVWLLIFRVFQGVGASMMMSSGPAIIKNAFPSNKLGSSLGLVGIATACGLLTGPFVSGILLSSGSWRSIFIVTLPVSLLAFLIGYFYLRQYLGDDKEFTWEKFDVNGSVYWVILVVLCISILHRLNNFLQPSTLLLCVLWGAFLFLFIRNENHAEQPILPLELFHERYFWVAVLTATISFAALFSVLVLVPFFCDYILETPVDKIGRVMMAVPATLIVLSPFSGWMFDKVGAKYLTSIGLSISCLALLSLALVNEKSTLQAIAIRLAFLGAGQSVFLSPNSASVLSQVSGRFIGVSSGILATARNLGMVIGATLAASLFASFFSYYSGGESLVTYKSLYATEFMKALQSTFLVFSSIALVGCLFSLRRR